MPTIGTDCDIILTHAAVNSGDPTGFICKRTLPKDTGVVSVHREVYLTPDGSYSESIQCFLTIIVADSLKQPNGAFSTRTRSAIYTDVIDYLSQRSGITLETPAATFEDLYATLATATEHHAHDHDEIHVQFNNGVLFQFMPLDGNRFYNSIWDGPLTWETSYWR